MQTSGKKFFNVRGGSTGCSGPSGIVPKIIHMSYDQLDKKPVWPKNLDAWKQTHPDWEFRAWSTADNRRMVQEHYPWFLATYDSFDRNVKRYDALRYMYMHCIGGVYVDMDLHPSRAIDSTLSNWSMALLRTREGVQNYFFASTPGQPWWLQALHSIVAVAALPKQSEKEDSEYKTYFDVLCATGWPLLTTVWTQWLNNATQASGKTAEGLGVWAFDESQFHHAWGLDHQFTGSWVGAESLIQLGEHGDKKCEVPQPGWVATVRSAAAAATV